MLKPIAAGLVAFFWLVFCSASYAACSWTILSNGTTADATAVANNFDCLAPLASPSFSGNVGIGTISSSVPLTVAGTETIEAALNNNSVLNVFSSGTGASIASGVNFLSTGTNNFTIQLWGTGNGAGLVGAMGLYDQTNGHFVWNTNSTDDLFGYTPIVNVVAGTGATWSILHTGQAYFNGSVGIGVSSPSYTLQVNGSVAGTSAYNNLSDARLKKNIRPIADPLTILNQLHGVRFDWKSSSERQIGKNVNLPVGIPQVGFVAQDLREALPEAVNVADDKDHTMSVAESKVVPVLVEALKQLEAANSKQTAALQMEKDKSLGLERRLVAIERKLAVRTASK